MAVNECMRVFIFVRVWYGLYLIIREEQEGHSYVQLWSYVGYVQNEVLAYCTFNYLNIYIYQ